MARGYLCMKKAFPPKSLGRKANLPRYHPQFPQTAGALGPGNVGPSRPCLQGRSGTNRTGRFPRPLSAGDGRSLPGREPLFFPSSHVTLFISQIVQKRKREIEFPAEKGLTEPMSTGNRSKKPLPATSVEGKRKLTSGPQAPIMKPNSLFLKTGA